MFGNGFESYKGGQTLQELNQHLQDSFVNLAITDTEFLALVIGQVPPDVFTAAITRKIVKICQKYYAEFKKAPQEHFHDELVKALFKHDDSQKQDFIHYVKKIQDITPNKPYVLKRIGDFVKQREYETAAIEFAELVEDQRFDEAQNRMYEALKAGIQQEETGLNYLQDLSSLSKRGEQIEYLIPTGINALDRMIGGYQRKQFVVICGGYKGGKTWALMDIARTGLMHGKKVLFISHEVGQDELELRFDMMFSSRGTSQIGKVIECKYYDKKRHELCTKSMEIRSVFENGIVQKARTRLARMGGRMQIKKYPMGQCSFAEIERYLNYLETYESFVPDIICNDYADIMDQNGGREDLRHQLSRIYIQHKGLADERNILVVTASQIATQYLLKKSIPQNAPAEDKRKIGHADIMLGIARTEEMVKEGMGRICIMANRSGSHQFAACQFSSCLDVGQFCLDSWLESDLEHRGHEALADGPD